MIQSVIPPTPAPFDWGYRPHQIMDRIASVVEEGNARMSRYGQLRPEEVRELLAALRRIAVDANRSGNPVLFSPPA